MRALLRVQHRLKGSLENADAITKEVNGIVNEVNIEFCVHVVSQVQVHPVDRFYCR